MPSRWTTQAREREADVFRRAVRHWTDGDFDAVVALLDDDICHTVNVDALGIPWMMTTKGKTEMAGRLALIRETFVINAFVLEALIHETRSLRATVYALHTHKKTGERLDVRLRFRVFIKSGRIARLEETVDGAYFEAFERFVRYLEERAGEIGSAPHLPN